MGPIFGKNLSGIYNLKVFTTSYNCQHQTCGKGIAMNNEELTGLIIKELGKHHENKTIIQKVCEEGGLNWSEAEVLVAEVGEQNKKKIAARQLPLLILFSIGTLVLGIALLAYNFEILVAIFNRDLLQQILGIQSGYYGLAGLVTGLGMTIGGLYGAGTALASLIQE